MAKSGVRQAGIRITIDGEKELSNQIRNIQSNLKTLHKEVELVEAKFAGQRNTLAALEAEYKALKNVQTDLAKSHDLLTKRGQLYQATLDKEAQKLKNLETVIASVKEQRAKAEEAGDTAKVQQLDHLLDSLNQKYTKQSAVVDKVASSLNKNRNQIIDNEKEGANLERNLERVSKGMEEAKKSTDKTAKSMDGFGKEVSESLQDIGSISDALSVLTGIEGWDAALSFLGELKDAFDECYKSAAQFEQSVVSITRTVDGISDAEAGAFLNELTKQLPVTAQELSAIASQGGQYGIQAQDLEQYTKVMAALATSTNLGLENTNMVAQLQGLLKTGVQDYERFASTIVDLGNNSRTTEKDIVHMAQTLATSAKGMKMSDAEILGLSAALASTGGSAEGTGSAMVRLMERIDEATSNGGDLLKNLARIAGLSAEEFKTAFGEDATGTIVDLIGGMKGIVDSGGDIYSIYKQLGISNIREKANLRNLISTYDDLKTSIDRANVAWDENVALAEESDKAYQTVQAQQQYVENARERFKTAVGEGMNLGLDNYVKFYDWLTTHIVERSNNNVRELAQYSQKWRGNIDPSSAAAGTVGGAAGIAPVNEQYSLEEEVAEEHQKKMESIYKSGASSIISQQEDAIGLLAEQTEEIRKMYESTFDPMEKFSEKGQITAKDFIKNLENNVAKMQEYNDNLVAVLEDPRVSDAMKEYLKNAGPDEVYKILDDLANDKDGKIIDSANQAMDKFNLAVSESSIETGIATGDVTDSVVNTLEGANLLGTSEGVGRSVGDGLIRGMLKMRKAVGYASSSLANEIDNRLHGTLKINSPSKVTQEVGRSVGEGLVLGMQDMENDISAQAARMAAMSANMYNGVLVGLQNGLNASIKVNSKDYSNVLNQISRNTGKNHTVVVEKPSRTSQSAVNDLERALVRGMLY